MQVRSLLAKVHRNRLLGTHSLDWDEAVKIAGADPDFHWRDLWEAIESGHCPEYELGMQIFGEDEAERFSFDVLDPTKIVPEELVPVTPVGRLVLNRNPDAFFAETEEVAFCAAHIVPGLDFSNEFVTDQYRHCKPILALGEGAMLLERERETDPPSV